MRQATLRRRSAFYILTQANEPDEDFLDPSSKRHDETLLSLLRRAAHMRPARDPDQLELWAPAPRPPIDEAALSAFQPRRSS